MSLLKFAIENQRWDLVAHVIVLAAARAVNEEVKKDGTGNKTEKGRSKR
jgi:hypothetical protein